MSMQNQGVAELGTLYVVFSCLTHRLFDGYSSNQSSGPTCVCGPPLDGKIGPGTQVVNGSPRTVPPLQRAPASARSANTCDRFADREADGVEKCSN